MGAVGLGLELRVKLGPDVKRVVCQLNDFN